MKKGKKETPPQGSKRRRGVRINSPQDVRRLLSRLINETLTDKIDEKKLRAITYSCSTILHVFELILFEKRIDQLEEQILEIRKQD